MAAWRPRPSHVAGAGSAGIVATQTARVATDGFVFENGGERARGKIGIESDHGEARGLVDVDAVDGLGLDRDDSEGERHLADLAI